MFEAFRHDISNNRTALMEKMSFDFEIMIYDYQSRYEIGMYSQNAKTVLLIIPSFFGIVYRFDWFIHFKTVLIVSECQS